MIFNRTIFHFIYNHCWERTRISHRASWIIFRSKMTPNRRSITKITHSLYFWDPRSLQSSIYHISRTFSFWDRTKYQCTCIWISHNICSINTYSSCWWQWKMHQSCIWYTRYCWRPATIHLIWHCIRPNPRSRTKICNFHISWKDSRLFYSWRNIRSNISNTTWPIIIISRI